jgi:hypothetical protein
MALAVTTELSATCCRLRLQVTTTETVEAEVANYCGI